MVRRRSTAWVGLALLSQAKLGFVVPGAPPLLAPPAAELPVPSLAPPRFSTPAVAKVPALAPPMALSPPLAAGLAPPLAAFPALSGGSAIFPVHASRPTSTRP